MSGYRQKIGKTGEDYAVNFLKENGYSIVTANFRTRYGEIDIIAREGGYLVFVEVKTRAGSKFGSGVLAVRSEKKHRLIKSALVYITNFKLYHESCRFDLLSLDVTRDGQVVGQELIKNAFNVDRRYKY